jgi:hypothetical protein
LKELRIQINAMKSRAKVRPMTFREEMDRFFKPFSAEERKAVENYIEYQEAAAKEDAIAASEIAHMLIIGSVEEPGIVVRRLQAIQNKKAH